MDEARENLPNTLETKNVLPDVVHSKQVTAVEADTTASNTIQEHSGDDNLKSLLSENDVSEIESISEHIPTNLDDSKTHSELGQSYSHQISKQDENSELPSYKKELENLPTSGDSEDISKHSDIVSDSSEMTQSNVQNEPSPRNISPQSTSYNQSDVHISAESPIVLALSSDTSKGATKLKNVSQNVTPQESPHSEFLDSLNVNPEKVPEECDKRSKDKGESPDSRSESEEIIKLDIRGQAAPKFSLQREKIIFGPPPMIGADLEPITVFQNLLSPCLVSTSNVKIADLADEKVVSPVKENILETSEIFLSSTGSVKIEEIFDDEQSLQHKQLSNESLEQHLTLVSPDNSDKIEQDLLVEEIVVTDEMKAKTGNNASTQPKSFVQDETISFMTMSTDYKTICEDCHTKLVHLEEAITQRDKLIEDLTVSLQQSQKDQSDLQHENEHLINEVQTLQHKVSEQSQSEHDTIKAQLSDFMKYQSMLKDESTKFYSALMSGTASLQSSNGEKDMDREEITVNYSKSDLRSSGSSEEFQTGIEEKLTVLLNKFESYIEENLRNKLREGMIQILGDEIGKMRMDYDTDVKELEAHIKQDKHESMAEIRRLRELLCSVKTGAANIDDLRQELNVIHEKEMEDLRTYFEKKCSDLERSYSEDILRGRLCASPTPSEGVDVGAGDAKPVHRSLTLEFSSTQENAVKIAKRYELVIEELKAEHVTYVNELQARHKEGLASLEEQITRLKAHIQTTENTEANEQLYQQDIDLELEKDARLRARDERVRTQLLRQLQEQLQVLLSDPDAELSSWPLELVALREKIHGEKGTPTQEKECVRDEAVGETDKWRQRRNNSFDQNRQLEEVTKERDGLKRVAVALQRAVSQLVAYCASAEDELNRTVLAHLAASARIFEGDSRPSSPNTTELNSSVVSRGKHVHFAPDLDSILLSLDEDGLVGFLQHQRDISADIKRELELSLVRLRNEAQELLELSARFAVDKVQKDSKMLESSPVRITELVEELENKSNTCENCQLMRKSMEEAMSECLQRESLLRADLDAAGGRIARLLTEHSHSDVIAEGFGAGECGAVGTRSLEAGRSPRDRRDLDALLRERDDLAQQLEAANRQLRSTRQFVEEQAGEREAERDEFAARLRDLRDDNARLAAKLAASAALMAEVEQLEIQAREMNQMIADLESRKSSADEELKSSEEKVTLLRDIIANLENQLEQKCARETKVLEQLEEMKRTIEERDDKMRELLGELESLRSERNEQSDVICVKCAQEDDKYNDLSEKIKEECERVARWVCRRRARVERAHERGSPATSDLTEDVSLPDRLQQAEGSPREAGQFAVLAAPWEALAGLARAEDAALKRIADLEMQRAALNDVAQEVRAERDVLQARMSEQALRISSLSARLQQQRHDADAAAHAAAGHLGVRLHDAEAEVQRLHEELEAKDKQLARLRQHLEEKDKMDETKQSLYGNSCNPKDKVIILERELSNAQAKIVQLEELARRLEMDKESLKNNLREYQRELAEKEEQLNEIMALKLEDEQNQNSAVIETKASARTLSDIVSISEYDEQDLQMRRAELKQNLSFTGAPEGIKINPNKTLPPEVQKPNMSSLHADYVDHFDGTNFTPRADSLPVHLTSTQNRETYKRNVNEVISVGTIDRLVDSAKQSPILENCSMYPNRNVSDTKNVSVEPKKINFSIEPSDNRTHDDDEFTSLRELGITLDIKQKNFPDILTQLKHEIKKSRTELETCKSELKNAEEQLCEFPALKEEVEQLKSVLENTVAAMENDKKFYKNQLESFSSNKKLLEQRVSELTQEANEKSKDLNLLKEDILRRENMILELAKEKRNLTNKITELDNRIEELQSKNGVLEKYENENKQMREQISELKKLEQLVSEKNQQIDSLNQHLDRLDDLQRRLNDKNDEVEHLKEALKEKANTLYQMQDSVSELNRDMAKVIQENDQLNEENKELKLNLSKAEKEKENALLKLQNSEVEVVRLNSLNSDLTSRIEELRQLNDKLKDKETEIEILHEDINVYHSEIALLKEQLKLVSRSPSPKNKSIEDRRTPDRHATNDKKQLVKIKKEISLLQHELDFNRKELNDKAFELAKAKLDLTELKTNLSQATKEIMEKEANNSDMQQKMQNQLKEIERLQTEKQQLSQQLETVMSRLREETDISEVKEKLREKAEKCQELEVQLINMRELVDRARQCEEAPAVLAVSRSRSPTAELERALRDQLHYSRALDRDMMDQILSASSDEREDIPRLALNTSRSSSIHSSTSERISRLKSENEKLEMQVNNLELRLKDKDALIAELNRVREQLSSECQSARLRAEGERDNSARLALLLDDHKESAEAVRQQDSNVIALLQRRLEGAMRAEAELTRQLQHLQHLQRPADPAHHHDRLQTELEAARGEAALARARLEAERRRGGELQALLERANAAAAADRAQLARANSDLRAELADLRRAKQEWIIETARARDVLAARAARTPHSPHTPHHAAPDTASPEPRAPAHEQAIRYLHGRCLNLESYRKALVWQKRYLQRVLAGYEELERRLAPANGDPKPPLRGIRRFRCVAWAAVVALRMRYVAARRARLRLIAADALLREHASPGGPAPRPLSRSHALASPGELTRSPLAVAAPTPRAEPFTTATPRSEVARKLTLNRLDR